MFGSAQRKSRKAAVELLRQAGHLFNMREDVLTPTERGQLKAAMSALDQALRNRDAADRESAAATLEALCDRLTPAKWRSSVRENLEVMLVAVAVAMAFRAYFMQPFKIPTGSMQPTLYGIHAITHDSPTTWDRHLPLKVVKLAFTGRWYTERRALSDGTIPHRIEDRENDPSVAFIRIGGVVHRLPKDAVLRGEFFARPGNMVRQGDLLWAGEIIRGDHLFVNKVIWNFRKPRRGEVMVFQTDGVGDLPPGTHYIKRTIGMPGETVSISPPDVLINEEPIREPEMIGRIAAATNGYDGFQLVDPRSSEGLLRHPSDRLKLASDAYFTLGDNTHNSRDSRYWGSVPAANLVGPAAFVYWPLSPRWGRRIR